MKHDPSETDALIDEVLGGNKYAFKRLVEMNQRLVSHIVFRMVTDIQDREDLCQEVFVKVYQNLARFRRESLLSTWIARIAYTTGISYLDKNKVSFVEESSLDYSEPEQSFVKTATPDIKLESKEISRLVRDEIDGLPVYYKVALTLYHLDGMSYAEITKVMKAPEGTIKSYIFRGRKLLRERLMSRYNVEDLWN